jgi:phosphate-selective porin OprO/OprP
MTALRSPLVRILTLALLATSSSGLLPRPAPAAEARTVLEEILDIMRKSGQITEEQRKALLERAEQEAQAAKAEREKADKELASRFTAGIENARPFLRSTDGDFRLQIGGRMHIDFHTTEPGSRTLNGAILGDRFLVRRARLDFMAEFFRWIDLRLDTDFTQSVAIKNAYLNFRFLPELAVKGGQFKVPFSLDQLRTANFIDFVERSVVDELAPGYDVGLSLNGTLLGGGVGYEAGVFNGVPEGALEIDSVKDLAGRVVLAPFKPGGNYWLKGLQVGGNVTWGDEGRIASAQGRTTARTSSRFVYFVAQPTNGPRTRVGGDLAWLVGPASLKFEWDQQTNERHACELITGTGAAATCAGGRDLDAVTARGFYATLTYLLTGEDSVLNGPVIPRRPFAPIAGRFGPGAWELALRYAQLKFSSDDPVDFHDGNSTNGVPGGGRTAENGVEALTAGVNWYLNSRVRSMFNFTQYWYDSALGTPFSCETGPCTAATLEPHGDTSWEILTRMQLWF